MNTIAKILAIVAIATASTAVAHAQDAQAQSIEIKTSDVNLTTKAGQDAMARHIKRAAIAVCGGRPANYDLSGSNGFKVCYDTTVSEAMTKLYAKIDKANTAVASK